ncbi:MAG TPA: GNAT family N-acetyltransferase [Pyrinomonadaceae bacterium]|nr:GNAT family N-acetyltransferase [Pyrinomonadaceae bacterium]
MNIRPVMTADAENCGRTIYEAFVGIADKHNFPHDFPTMESAIQMAQMCINSPQIYGFVAEDENGKFLGSNFLWEHDAIRGVGPITIDPNVQSKGVGRRLMHAVIERGKDAPGIRLVQDTFNTASMPLYASLGFNVVEPLVIIQGTPKGEISSKTEVRRIEKRDFEEANELCRKIHGFDRGNELKQTSQAFPTFVAVRENRVVAYATAPIMWQLNHAVAETTEDMQELLLGAAKLTGQPLSFLLPIRQAELFRWCLNQGLRVIKPMTLMAMGEYHEPRGCFLPSVLY